MKDVLPNIINSNQTFGVKGRSIHDGAALIRDLIDYVNKNNLSGLIISLDQTKAFDRVEWSFLFKVLQKFNFGPKFIHMIKTCYTKIQSCVKVNGYISAYFNLSRGIRQGCPISVLLYILVAEILATAVRTENEIKGIKLPNGQESKWVGYSDDGNATLTDFNSVKKLFKLLEIYQRASGAKVNLQKTQGFLMGKLRYEKDTPLDIRWTNDKIKIFGFYFGNVDVLDDNWKPKINKLKTILNIWLRRKLTLNGKVTVVNSLATSQIWYLSNVITLPEKYINELDKLISDFIWSKGRHLISREQLQLPKELGGLGVVNIRQKIKAQRIKYITRFLSLEGEGTWKILAEHFMGQYKNLNLKVNVLKCKVKKNKCHFLNMPNIYRECLLAWTDLDITREISSVQQILNEPLHDNPLLGVERTWKIASMGLNLVADIWDETIDDFRQVAGLRSSPALRQQIADIKVAFPQPWIDILKANGVVDAVLNDIYKVDIHGTMTDVLTATTKSLYTEALTKTNKEALCKTKWGNVLSETINWDKVWKTINTNLIEHSDFDIIFKLIHYVIAVRKHLCDWKIAPTPECLVCDEVDSVLHAFFHCPKTKQFIDNIEYIFKQLFGNDFKLNEYKVIFGVTHSLGNNASKLGIFLWSKVIKTIWISRKLLEKHQPCNEMALFKNYIRNRIKAEHSAAIEEPHRKEKFLNYWCFGNILASCSDDFQITMQI